MAKNCLRSESAPLEKFGKIRELKRHLRNFQGFILLNIITCINLFPTKYDCNTTMGENTFLQALRSVQQMFPPGSVASHHG